ncbi:MAG: SIS domain-containing protein [Planctomycetota bacterium]|jgi:arabinose-5-phosphate isomerase
MAKLSRKEMVSKARKVVESESEAVKMLTQQINEEIFEVVDLLLNCKGHVLVTGAGTCRPIAERFAHLLSCCGTPALYISAADSLHGGSGAVTDRNVVYAISKGGRTAEINDFVKIAKANGAKVIAQTENHDSPLAKISDIVYKIVARGDVDPYGMIATGSSLVNGAACDVLCVLLLEARGYAKDMFGKTHPGGAVGQKLAKDEMTEKQD